MLVLGTLVYVKAFECAAGERVLREHAVDSQFEGLFRAFRHQTLVLHFLQSADPAAVAAVIFLLQLIAGQTASDALMIMTKSPQSTFGVYVGLCFPRSRTAA